MQRCFSVNAVGRNIFVSLATTNKVNQNIVTWIRVQIKVSVLQGILKEGEMKKKGILWYQKNG